MSEVTRWRARPPEALRRVGEDREPVETVEVVRWDDYAALAARVAELEGALGKIAERQHAVSCEVNFPYGRQECNCHRSIASRALEPNP